MKIQIELLEKRAPDDIAAMLDVWEGAVRATHDFLTEADIREMRPLVEEGVSRIAALLCIRDEAGRIIGFLGMDGDKVEMLFIDSTERGKGLGGALLEHAVERLGARYVDVNEQNPLGVGFYLRMGFSVFGRSGYDGQGKPFPLLHMRR